jgi:hypothetical protein
MRSTDAPKPLSSCLVILALAAAALYPALWNGFPLVFDDSAVYFGSFNIDGIPPFYPLFVVLSSAKWTLFLTAAAQALLAAAVVTVFLRSAGGVASLSRLLLLGLGVLLLNQAPFLVSWIMPDLLAGLGIAALIVLLLAPERLSVVEMGFLVGVVWLSALCASANMPIYIVLAGFCLVLRWGLMRKSPLNMQALLTCGAVTAAVALTLLANHHLFGRAELNSAGPVLTFSRLADIGVAQPVVERECRSKHFAVCSHLAALKTSVRGGQTFLWDGVAEQTHAYGATRGEYAILSRTIIRESPAAILREGLIDTRALFLRPTLGSAPTRELVPYPSNNPVALELNHLFPRDAAAFAAARQQTGELQARFPVVFFAASTYVSYAVVIVLIGLAWRRGERTAVALGLATLAAIAGQLLLHSFLVGPFPRYHVKVAWLGWLISAALWERLGSAPARVDPHFRTRGRPKDSAWSTSLHSVGVAPRILCWPTNCD